MQDILDFFKQKKNLVNILTLAIMVAGLPIGIQLARTQQVLFSQAAEKEVEFYGPNVKQRNNKLVATKPQVMIQISSKFGEPIYGVTNIPPALLQLLQQPGAYAPTQPKNASLFGLQLVSTAKAQTTGNCCAASDRNIYTNGSITGQCNGAYVGANQCGCGNPNSYCYEASGSSGGGSKKGNWEGCSSDSECTSNWCGCNGDTTKVCLPNSSYTKTCSSSGGGGGGGSSGLGKSCGSGAGVSGGTCQYNGASGQYCHGKGDSDCPVVDGYQTYCYAASENACSGSSGGGGGSGGTFPGTCNCTGGTYPDTGKSTGEGSSYKYCDKGNASNPGNQTRGYCFISTATTCIDNVLNKCQPDATAPTPVAPPAIECSLALSTQDAIVGDNVVAIINTSRALTNTEQGVFINWSDGNGEKQANLVSSGDSIYYNASYINRRYRADNQYSSNYGSKTVSAYVRGYNGSITSCGQLPVNLQNKMVSCQRQERCDTGNGQTSGTRYCPGTKPEGSDDDQCTLYGNCQTQCLVTGGSGGGGTAALPAPNLKQPVCVPGLAGTRVKIEWDAVPGAQEYNMRLDYLEDGWSNCASTSTQPNDACLPFTTTHAHQASIGVPNDFGVAANKPYKVWLHAVKDQVLGSVSAVREFTCTPDGTTTTPGTGSPGAGSPGTGAPGTGAPGTSSGADVTASLNLSPSEITIGQERVEVKVDSNAPKSVIDVYARKCPDNEPQCSKNANFGDHRIHLLADDSGDLTAPLPALPAGNYLVVTNVIGSAKKCTGGQVIEGWTDCGNESRKYLKINPAPSTGNVTATVAVTPNKIRPADKVKLQATATQPGSRVTVYWRKCPAGEATCSNQVDFENKTVFSVETTNQSGVFTKENWAPNSGFEQGTYLFVVNAISPNSSTRCTGGKPGGISGTETQWVTCGTGSKVYLTVDPAAPAPPPPPGTNPPPPGAPRSSASPTSGGPNPPGASPQASGSPSGPRLPDGTSHFRVSEDRINLDSSRWQEYLNSSMLIPWEFENKEVGLKSFFVQFAGIKGGKPFVTEPRGPFSIEYVGEDPQILGLSCSYDISRSAVKIDINGTNLGDRNLSGLTATPGGTAEILEWTPSRVNAILKTAPSEDTNYLVTLKRLDGQTVQHQCRIGTSMLSLGAKLFCRSPQRRNQDNVDLLLKESTSGGRLVREKVSIDKDGYIKSIKTKLAEGTRYDLSLKVPKSLRKNATFTAAPGTTVLNDFILPVGDIAPSQSEGDGAINSFDKTLLIGEWGKGSSSNIRLSDLNLDGRVNSVDWACMKYDFGKSSDPEL